MASGLYAACSDGVAAMAATAIQALETATKKVMQLPAELLSFANYQRADKVQWQEKAAKAFDSDLLGVLLVSLREGRYWVFDGRQRVGLAAKAGWRRPFDVLVYEGLTYKDEAELFRAFNEQRTAVGRPEVFKARLEAADPAAWQLYDIAAEFKVVVATASSGYTSAALINAVGSLERMQRSFSGDEDRIRQFFRIVTTAWPEEPHRWKASIIEGLTAFLLKYPWMDEEVLLARLREVQPTTLIAEADALRRVMTIPLVKSFGMTFAKRYNKGLRTRKLEAWDETPGGLQERPGNHDSRVVRLKGV